MFKAILLLSPLTYAQTAAPLSTGNWYRIGVTQSGIYRLDAAFFRKLGVNASDVSPQNISLLSGQAGMLPQSNEKSPPLLRETAIQVTGEADGRFDPADAVYFYAEGPHVTSFDSVSASFSHQLHTYSDTAFYFLHIGTEPGRRIQPALLADKPGSQTISYFEDYWYHEVESVNLLKSGRDWWGEYLGTGPSSFQARIPGVLPNSEIRISTSAVGAAQIKTQFVWSLNGTTIGESAIGTVSTSTYDIKGIRTDKVYAATAGANPSQDFNLGVRYDKNGQNSAQGYLNYIGLQTKRNFTSYETQQLYHLRSGDVTYQFSNNTQGWNLWDVTDSNSPAVVKENMPAGTFEFTPARSLPYRKIAGFGYSQAFEPVSGEKIDNQGLADWETPEMLIITAPAWQAEAARLAAYRQSHDGISAAVATTRQVYNEFSGGKPDVSAIRNFVRYLSGKKPGRLRYLLLFGDATYDYKNNLLNQAAFQRGNWVPVYESRESLNPVYTYSSDDYFGFLEKTEGTWTEAPAGDHTLDIGIGRLPAKTVAEARIIVDKLIRYDKLNSSSGLWKNKVQFVADDGDGNIHQQHADQLARLIEGNFLSTRLFIDAFPQNTTEQGPKAPAVNTEIVRSIDKGTLILNYTGHGGVSGWAEEQVLTLTDMQAARGIDNLPLLLTATCDFGRYDDPAIVSGAEIMVLSPKGAAIGSISTTRPVYSSTNYTLSRAFYETLVSEKPDVRIGDIFRDTKNKALVGSLNRNFTLLADPSMRLARPARSIRWTSQPDTLRALQAVTLAGEVFMPGNQRRDSLFNGSVRVVIYDKETPFVTFGNEGTAQEYSEFTTRLFDGMASVRNGRFTIRFTVPKDIDYRTGPGRADLYAIASDTLAEAAGQLSVIVGGSKEVPADDTPPFITAYLDDESFRNGGQTGPSPILFINATDDTGINVSKAGIDHNITITLNDTLTIVLNDYFVAALDNPSSGMVVYPFENLPAGKYNARVKVWDVHTNSSEIAFAFQVGAAAGIRLNALNVFPNPFDKELSLELSHSRQGEDVEIIFSIFLNNGQKLGVFRQQHYNSESTIRQVIPMQPGTLPPPNSTLIYQVEVRSLRDNSADRNAGKLIRSP